MMAQVIEDRGRLGVNGRRLYRIQLDMGTEEPFAFEVPEVDLEPAGVPDKAVILRYLKGGGLVHILRSNLGDEQDKPRAWLSFTLSGDVTHTLEAWRGVIGGEVVPYFALHERKVFAGKREQVVKFLTSFGLTRAEAEDVVRTVGTGP